MLYCETVTHIHCICIIATVLRICLIFACSSVNVWSTEVVFCSCLLSTVCSACVCVCMRVCVPAYECSGQCHTSRLSLCFACRTFVLHVRCWTRCVSAVLLSTAVVCMLIHDLDLEVSINSRYFFFVTVALSTTDYQLSLPVGFLL